MRKLLFVLAIPALASPLAAQDARAHLAGDRFALFTECAPVGLEVIGDDDIARMAENRFRAVGLLGALALLALVVREPLRPRLADGAGESAK